LLEKIALDTAAVAQTFLSTFLSAGSPTFLSATLSNWPMRRAWEGRADKHAGAAAAVSKMRPPPSLPGFY